MSKFLALIQNKNKKERLEAKPVSWRKLFLGVKTLNVAIIVMICFFGILYLAETNSMAVKGFAIKKLDDQQATLKDSIRKVDFQVAEMQSTAKIQARIAALNMVSVAKVDYATGTSAVAVK